MVSDAVIPEIFPETIAEEIGRDDSPDSPVTTIVDPPSFTQVPFDNWLRDCGIFHPFESPK